MHETLLMSTLTRATEKEQWPPKILVTSSPNESLRPIKISNIGISQRIVSGDRGALVSRERLRSNRSPLG